MWRKHFCLSVRASYFAEKFLTMKRSVGIVALVAAIMSAVQSCGVHEIGKILPDTSDGDVWGGPIEENDGAGIIEQICYMTALDYQKGYDWRADRDRDNVRCSLIVYADGRLIMKVPVGKEYETGPDPDMHRIMNGHLYTDYSTSDETVIKKDGAQIFRYPGREVICGMASSGDDVFTLGQNREGAGFTYRKNGEIVISRENGWVMGDLRHDEDSLYFAFSERIISSAGEVWRYYAVRNGKVRQIAVRDDVLKVWDAICDRRSEIYVASLVGVAEPVLFHEGRMLTLPLPSGDALLSATLSGHAERPVVEMMCLSEGGIYSVVWQEGDHPVSFPEGNTVSSMCCPENGVCCTINPQETSSEGLIYRCGEVHDMPCGFACLGSNAICMVNGILNVGLVSHDGKEVLIWKDGETETLKINGYIASITAQ